MTHRLQLPWMVKLAVVGLSVLFAAGSRTAAAETGVREFNVTIDGKQAGSYRMTIQKHDNGSVSMIGQANIKVSYIVASYRYNYTGSEIWMNGRLYGLKSETDDDGTKYSVNAVATADGLKITSNGQERTTRPDVWLSTYWHKPDARFLKQGIPLVDADTGKDLNATLQLVGNQELTVAGQRQSCSHYRLRGGVTVDVWYDGQERLVREESVEDGHRMVMELTGVR